MIKEFVVSRDVNSGAHSLNHIVAASTYSAAPTLASQGFYVRAASGRNYDAFELSCSFSAPADSTTKMSLRPWYYIPAHDPTGSGGTWLSGKTLDNITLPGAGTDVNSPLRRINTIVAAATKMFIQVTVIDGTPPTNAYITVYGLLGDIATVDADSVAVEVEVGDVIAAFAQETISSPADFTATFATASTITAAGAPFVISDLNARVVYVMYRHAGGQWAAPLINGIAGVSITAAANVITVSGASAPFLAGDDFWIGVQNFGAAAAAGSAGAGMGGGLYMYLSPQDFSAVFSAVDQITLTGIPFSPTLAQVVEVTRYTAAGSADIYSPLVTPFVWVPATGVLTITGAVFGATDTFRAVLVGPDKAMTPATNSLRTQEINPLSGQHVWEQLLNSAAVTAATYYLPSSSGLSMLGFRNLLISLQTTATGLITIEGSADPAGTDWIDISRGGYDVSNGASGVANWSSATAMLAYEELEVPLVRVKLVVVGANATVQIDVRRTAI